MKNIEKIILHNFKRFDCLEVDFDSKINILIGDNEAGKSTILQAINLVLSGSINKIETIGLENLFNYSIVDNFMNSQKNYNDLPILSIELYLGDMDNPNICGFNNSKEINKDGLKLVISPNDELSQEINEVLNSTEPSFPFEFYIVDFKTFADFSYSSYRKFLKSVFIDNSQVSSEYAMREYIRDIYNAKLSNIERRRAQYNYRNKRINFQDEVLSLFNNRLSTYRFALKNSIKLNLEANLTINEDNICIENKGKGKQCFVKTELALERSDEDLDVVLLEEPENHLSHTNMHKLIQMIQTSNNKQLFFSTHNNLISTRLGLNNTIFINSCSLNHIKLNTISTDTADFFMKAPDNNLLQLILSKKVILVEGDAEYILIEKMFKIITQYELMNSGIHVISIDGTSFKRYLDISKIIGVKTAVITDNDGHYENNINHKYINYRFDNIAIFADEDNSRRTFEICMYQDNKILCDELFSERRRSLSVENFMLSNKSEVAYQLSKKEIIEVPQYIKNAIEWINQ